MTSTEPTNAVADAEPAEPADAVADAEPAEPADAVAAAVADAEPAAPVDAAAHAEPAAPADANDHVAAAPPPNAGVSSPPTRGDRWLIAALVLATVACIAPFFAGRWLPFLDMPQHVGAVAILAGGDPAMAFDRYYGVQLLSSPYLLPYLAAAALARLIGAVDAVRLLFALAAGLLPWSLAFAARRFDRDPRFAVLAVPLAFSTFLFLGFLNFVLALPLFFFWLGWWRGRVGADHFSWRDAVTGALLGILIFYGHVMILGFAMGACGLVALIAVGPDEARIGAWRALGRRSLRALHIAPALALLLVWALTSPVAERGELGRMIGGALANEPPQWPPLLDGLKALLDYTLSGWHGHQDTGVFVRFLGLLGLFAALTRGRRPATARAWLGDRLPVLLLLSALALAVVMPESWRGIWPIGARMVPVALLLALLVPSGRLVVPRLALIIGLTLAAYTSVVHVRGVRAFQAEVGPLDEVIAPLPMGARVMTLIFDPTSRIAEQPAYLHFGQYVLAERGGVVEFSFVNFTKSPIQYVEAEAPPRLPARFEWTPDRFDPIEHGGWFDYVIARDAGWDRRQRIFGAQQDRWSTLHRAGPWVLYGKDAGTREDHGDRDERDERDERDDREKRATPL